jgi:hypothetical protein
MQHTTVELMGGLGNQLFQIFALGAYSFRHKTPFYFSPEPIQHGPRKQTYWQTPLLQTLKPFVKAPLATLPPPLLVIERGFEHQDLPFYQYEREHVKLFGYFQSYKYFHDQQANLCKLIRLADTQALIKANTPAYAYANTIAVHFRVGDYVALPNHHPLMTLAYYTAALTQFLQDQDQDQEQDPRSSALCETVEQASKQQKTHILYFCEKNDQPFVDAQFIEPLKAVPAFQGKFTFQCIDHALADWEQLTVMSLCQHHIIANSTFSWWGAYLGGHPPRPPCSRTDASASAETCMELAQNGVGRRGSPQVYYPSTWFGPAMGHKNLADLFPPHWHKI